MKYAFAGMTYEMDEATGNGKIVMRDGTQQVGNAVELWNKFTSLLHAAGSQRIGNALEQLGRNRFGLDENTGFAVDCKAGREGEV